MEYKLFEFSPTGIYAGNKDIFFIKNYSFLKDTTPNDSGISFSLEEEKKYIYRMNIKGSLVFYGEDYNLMKDALHGCGIYVIKAYSCGERSEFIKSLFWDDADYIGFIRPKNITLDKDKCEASVTVDTFDVYTKFLSEYENKLNLFSITNRVWVSGMYFGDNVEYFTKEGESYDIPSPYQSPIIECNNDNQFIGGVMIKLEYEHRNSMYSYKKTYAREHKEIEVSTSADIPLRQIFGKCFDVISGGYTWISTGEFKNERVEGNRNKGTLKVVRPINGITVNEIYSENLYYQTQNGFILSILGSATKNRGILLNQAIKNLRTRCGYTTSDTGQPQYKTSSQFLFSKYNPIDGHYPNDFEQIVLMQKSDAKNNSDRATKFEISLKDVLDALSYMNLYWFIDKDETLIIEHISFFEKGLTYSGAPQYPYYYAKDYRNIIKHNEDEPPKSIKFTTQDSNGVDFVGVPIKFLMCHTNETEEITFNICFDIQNIISSQQDEISNDGVVMFCSRMMPYNYKDENGNIVSDVKFFVLKGIGAYSNTEVPNARLSTANVHEFLWNNYLPAPSVVINEQEKFPVLSRIFYTENVPIKIKHNEIDPRRLVYAKTVPSIISSAEYSMKKKCWYAKLTMNSYE